MMIKDQILALENFVPPGSPPPLDLYTLKDKLGQENSLEAQGALS